MNKKELTLKEQVKENTSNIKALRLDLLINFVLILSIMGLIFFIKWGYSKKNKVIITSCIAEVADIEKRR